MTDETKPQGEAPEPVEPLAQAETVEPSEKPATEPEQPFDKERAMATIKAQRESEKALKAQLKELEQLKAEKAERELAEMSETERLKTQAENALAENAKLKADLLKRDVIAETGLPPVLAERLQGTTKEEMLADAEKLKAALPAQPKTPPHVPPTNPNNANPNETEAQKRERLFGRQGNVFDLEEVVAGGGGVVWNKPKE